MDMWGRAHDLCARRRDGRRPGLQGRCPTGRTKPRGDRRAADQTASRPTASFGHTSKPASPWRGSAGPSRGPRQDPRLPPRERRRRRVQRHPVGVPSADGAHRGLGMWHRSSSTLRSICSRRPWRDVRLRDLRQRLSRQPRACSPGARGAGVLATIFAVADILRRGGQVRLVRQPAPALAVDDLERLLASGLVDVQAHSRTHPRLTALDEAQLRDETAGAKERLDRILPYPVTSYCYPAGLYGPREVRAVLAGAFVPGSRLGRGSTRAASGSASSRGR